MKSEKSKFFDDCYERVYSGDMTVFEECFTPDYKLTIPETQMMTEAGFLKGKLALEFLGTELDFAQGDLKKAVAKILKMEPMIKEMKAKIAKGELPGSPTTS